MRNGPIWSQITKKMFLLFQPLSCRRGKSFKGPAAKLSSPLDCKLSRYVGEGKGRSENRMIQFSFSCGRRRKKFYTDRRNRGGNLCARLSVHFSLQPPPFFFFPRGQCSERTKSGGRTKEKKRKKRLLSIPSVPFSPSWKGRNPTPTGQTPTFLHPAEGKKGTFALSLCGAYSYHVLFRSFFKIKRPRP